MKKLTAFLTALVLFLVSAAGMHFYAESRITVNNNAFSFWAIEKKFVAREALTKNINADTVAVFGSSEFQHGRKTPYHPGNMFAGNKFNMMLIGAGYYQSLSHALTLASIGNDLPTKEAVLFISPQWFRSDGVLPEPFSSRFSETHYIGMLQNPNLSKTTKTYIIERVKTLLKADPPALERTELYEKVLSGNASFSERLNYRLYTSFLKEKELQSVAIRMARDGIKKNASLSSSEREPDFQALMDQAGKDGEKENSGNPFFMDDSSYRLFIRPFLKAKKNQSVNGSYSTSPEYTDLECFLHVCQDLGIRPLLVSLPVNGYWYDYTGFPKKERQIYYEKIRQVAKKYGAELADFADQEYTKYFFEDGVHIGKKGWVMINESIYRFYQKNKTDKTL